MLTYKNKKSGFTIVELLIVIVVIGILATITIVSYNGIQSKAKTVKKQSEISSMTKAVQLHNAAGLAPVTIRSTMTTAQIDAAITTLGLNALKGSLVIDTAPQLNGGDCNRSPMAKDKYCITVQGTSMSVVFWHDEQNRWILRYYNDGGFVESYVGTGNYPNVQEY